MFSPSAASAKIRNGVMIAESQYWLPISHREDEQQRHGDAILADRKDLLVFRVARLELPCFPVEHRAFLP
jgi:hypothetical protein